jgi:ABC-2 type transport system permease protein
MIAIYKRELKAYFHTFIGALFIGANLFLMGIYFSVYNLFMGYPHIGYPLSAVVFLFLISIPILTMRILSEERKQKTDQLILTSPVSVTGIVVGKFLALATIFTIPVVIISIYPLLLSMFGTVALGESYVALLGYYLYGLSCIAICMLISSLTESQVIAAVLSFAVLFLGYVMSGICTMISSTGNVLTTILSAFDTLCRFEDMLNGSLQLSSVVYYISVIVLALIFTVQSIQKRRYHVSKNTFALSGYSSAVLIISTVVIVLFNMAVAKMPMKYTVFDVTTNKLYSLTEETIQLVSELTEDINIYVIVNDKQADELVDTTLQQYAALNNHIKVSYIDPAVNPQFYTKYTEDGINSNSIIVESSKRSKVIDYSEIYQSEMDYYTYSYTTTGYDGEGQVTSAIAYVTTDDIPMVYLVEGHGENQFDSSFLSIIEKSNAAYQTINLMDYEKIPEDAGCVVINAPSADFSDDDTDKMINYMEQGGDVLLVSGYTGEAMPNFEKLLEFYGVEVSEGMIIEGDLNYYYQDPFYLLPEVVYDTVTESVYNSGAYVFVPYAQGLTYEEKEKEKENVTVTPLLSTTKESYLRNNLDAVDTYDKQEDDIDGPFHVGLKCETSTVEGSSLGLIFSSNSLFTPDADSMVAGNNSMLFSGSIGAFTEYAVNIAIPVKNYEVEYLTIPQSTLVLLALVTIIVIPFVILTAGFMVWVVRRKR